ncbi:MAG: hypothetical protein ACOX4L_11360 [Bacillota bacterium]
MVDTISKSIGRFDAKTKLEGNEKYLCDLEFDELIYAKTLRSSKPRANILSIDFPELPPGYYIVDKNDIPGKNRVKMILDDQPFFAEDRVNYVGEPILLVVGPDHHVISEILSHIKVNYQEIEPIFDIEDAEKGLKKLLLPHPEKSI